jgi:hypothetical protein
MPLRARLILRWLSVASLVLVLAALPFLGGPLQNLNIPSPLSLELFPAKRALMDTLTHADATSVGTWGQEAITALFPYGLYTCTMPVL